MVALSTWTGTILTMTAVRPYHHGNLRPALLQCAERALARGGVQNLSLRELARELGVSHAAPRRHFADRQALFDALAIEGFERLEAALTEALDAPGASYRARLAAFARTYVRFATEHAALLELMYAAKHQPGAEALHEAAGRAFTAPFGLVAEGVEAGELAGGEPERVGILIWATLQGLVSMANSGMLAGVDLDELVTESIDRLVDGLAPR